MHVIAARNVNDAYNQGGQLIRDYGKEQDTRYGKALVVEMPVTTRYSHPTERVLFDAKRDANPFFHFFEALWIINGQKDVKTLAYFNKRMAEFSDDGVNYHAPYGYRLRHTPCPVRDYMDQIEESIKLLKANNNSRQVVMSIWCPSRDLGASKKDIPCNDMIKLRIVNGALDIMVFCRSNDMIWGAYGANVFQFSSLQEYIAGCVGVPVGAYYQISCDFHAYVDTWEKADPCGPYAGDPYMTMTNINTFPMFAGIPTADKWDNALADVMETVDAIATGAPEMHVIGFNDTDVPYFDHVAIPLLQSWMFYKERNFQKALNALTLCAADDLAFAAKQWLQRRIK
jgi:thymidylate synthase